MVNERQFPGVPEGSSFELLFRWGDTWTDIHVYPITTRVSSTHYLIRLAMNIELIIRLNENGEWEELHDGVTELARHLGKAVETYCLAHGRF